MLSQSRVVSLRPAECVRKKFEAMWAEDVSPHTQVYQEPEASESLKTFEEGRENETIYSHVLIEKLFSL